MSKYKFCVNVKFKGGNSRTHGLNTNQRRLSVIRVNSIKRPSSASLAFASPATTAAKRRRVAGDNDTRERETEPTFALRQNLLSMSHVANPSSPERRFDFSRSEFVFSPLSCRHSCRRSCHRHTLTREKDGPPAPDCRVVSVLCLLCCESNLPVALIFV